LAAVRRSVEGQGFGEGERGGEEEVLFLSLPSPSVS